MLSEINEKQKGRLGDESPQMTMQPIIGLGDSIMIPLGGSGYGRLTADDFLRSKESSTERSFGAINTDESRLDGGQQDISDQSASPHKKSGVIFEAIIVKQSDDEPVEYNEDDQA